MPPRVADRGFYGGPVKNGDENPGDDSNLGKPNSQSLDVFNHKKDS